MNFNISDTKGGDGRGIPVFVINLKESAGRLQKIKKSLDDIGVPFERVEAVAGRDLSESEIARHYSAAMNKRLYYTPLTRGEIGCYLSHIKVWRKIVDENLDCAVILEDDAVPHADFAQIGKILAGFKPDWDYIKLINPGHKKKIVSEVPALGEFEGRFKMVRWKKPPAYTAAQIVTKKAAEKLLSVRDVFWRPVDVDLQYEWEHGLKICGILPELVGVDADAKSTVQKNIKKSHYPFARPLCKIKYLIASCAWAAKNKSGISRKPL